MSSGDTPVTQESEDQNQVCGSGSGNNEDIVNSKTDCGLFW